MEPDQIIRTAIRELRLIQFQYDGLARVAEPHDYGEQKGERRLLVYQVGGRSKSGRLPDWRLVTLTKASGFELLSDTFAGPRDIDQRHQKWDRLMASARFRVLANP